MKRRTFLTGAFAGTAALALGVNLYLPNITTSSEDIHHRVLFGVLIPVFLDGALPEVPSQRELAINRTLDAISQSITHLPVEQQQELMELLNLLEGRLGLLLLSGSMTPLLMREPQQLIDMLEFWRHNYLDMLTTAYGGLRELIMASYYACPEHWGNLRYVKPTFLVPNAH
ncbi:TAT leader-containing periplasmic protein [Shewanella sp. SR43-4]|uniref:TAT leader-containing periplasmic protein n=1 Tax=Shewanella TaxID=22 RepID=UPI000F5039AF|nr:MULTISPECIES: TAT leader-containing periplasmic protein [Shewanella]MBB1316131.1 TAT leader-containing periplasmic protein [Shewanella sp. SR43-4]MBB1320883.1 TAT leader-containing periplasmic protein [Shewanella sp. SR43-8]RPA35483.1 TAT leader-containing periplasmic protein [Shewanella vesiculosa]UJL42572.1 TAT leader-containing periplasmic protein [Shewanella vesiculosa]|tara:strand:- start:1005 stop:1517 length:513 start_codon:yes stop_codon:yes gene_type:complete